MQYTIKTPNENPLVAVIEKTGISAEFTIKDVQDHTKYLKKTSRELEGKVLVEDAKATNIIAFNPFLNDLTEEQIHAAHLYFESMAFCKEAEDKLKEINEQIESYEQEMIELLKQTGIELTPDHEVVPVEESEVATEEKIIE